MLKKIALAVVAYPACWVLAHCAVMLLRSDGLSLQYLAPYFRQAWTFSAGELPSFIWLASLVLYGKILVVWFALSKQRHASAA